MYLLLTTPGQLNFLLYLWPTCTSAPLADLHLGRTLQIELMDLNEYIRRGRSVEGWSVEGTGRGAWTTLA